MKYQQQSENKHLETEYTSKSFVKCGVRKRPIGAQAYASRPALHKHSLALTRGDWEMVVELSYNLIALCFTDIQIHYLYRNVIVMSSSLCI